jgi:hypothetical protein
MKTWEMIACIILAIIIGFAALSQLIAKNQANKICTSIDGRTRLVNYDINNLKLSSVTCGFTIEKECFHINNTNYNGCYEYRILVNPQKIVIK